MLKKSLSIIFIVLMFVMTVIFIIPHDKTYKVININSPTSIELDSGVFKFQDLESFDSTYSIKNSLLAKSLNITEEEAFILGNLSKTWAENLIKGRTVLVQKDNDIIYVKYSYRTKFLHSGFCLINSRPYDEEAFDKKLNEIRRSKYVVINLDNDELYEMNDKKIRDLKNFLVIRKNSLDKKNKNKHPVLNLKTNKIKVYFTDSTSKVKPDRNCSSDICREILEQINNAKDTIDIAIYGYSRIPSVEDALKKALKRNVKIRLVYDMDSKGKNIYPDTDVLRNLIKLNNNDSTSVEAQNIMHNKFYIFDEKIVITGSANLSHTDMSGFNSNSIVVFDSPEVARIYKNEFNQMYKGKFHNEKISLSKQKVKIDNKFITIYFSPKDKSITNVILPLIKNANNYIYIPTFVLTEKRVTEELIRAKQRGVDVKIIIDALNASIKHSKHNELRQGGLLVKTENYAGKMHSKSMIIDDKYTVIGSMNFSNSGENKNDENLILIEDEEIAKFYKVFFLYQWNKIDNKWLYTNVRAEGADSIGSCFDGIDNNYDGLIDAEDPACIKF